jgi:hypothetical protein
MIYIAFRLEVFLRPGSFPTLVFKWVNILPINTDYCVRADYVLNISSLGGRPWPLLRSGRSREEGFVL